MLVVDDHPVFAESLATALASSDIVETTIWVANADDARAAVDQQPFDVALLDLRMPDVDGVELIAELSGRDEIGAVVVLSIAADERSVLRALEAGARGFLSKSDQFDFVLWSLHSVANGGAPISPTIFARVLPRLIGENAEHALTGREEVVLEIMSGGASNKEIAEQLDLSTNTVRNHLYNIMRKLDADNRNEAVARARELGILPSTS